MENAPLGVEGTELLEDLSDDGNGGVDGVGNNKDEGIGGGLSNACCQILDDTGIDLEEQMVN